MCSIIHSKSAVESAGAEGMAMGRLAAKGADGRTVVDFNHRCNAACPSPPDRLRGKPTGYLAESAAD